MRATRKLGRYLKPYWLWATIAPLLMALEVAMDLMIPRLIQRIVDQGVVPGDMDVVVQTGVLMVVLAVIGMVGGVGCTVFALLAAQGFGADLRGALFGKVQALSFGNLDRLETGKLITRLTNDVVQVQEAVAILLRIMVRVPLLFVGSLVMAVLASPRLSLVFVVLIPVVMLALIWIISRMYPMYGRVQTELDGLNTIMEENLSGVRVVRAFARGKHEIARFGTTNDRLMDRNVAAVRMSAATMPLIMLALNFGVVAAVWIGGVRINAGSLQVGELIAFINYLMQVLMSLMMISMLVVRLSRAEASADRVQEVLDSEPEVVSVPRGKGAHFVPRGRVEFENVSLSYGGGDRDPALTDVDLTAEPGQTIALLGATGAGKSSLVGLIPRFYDVDQGRITIDGVDVREIEEEALRSAVGVALQESILFTGSIRDNIAYGRPDATDDEVFETARIAQAHDFISVLPEGYNTVVGQRGVNLSGGQKQRIAIARVLLLRPAVLILDDSTSAVDVATEAAIREGLSSLGTTRFVVAQRISSVLGADEIIVLDDGKIAARGTHDELLASSPIYREIYDSQTANGVATYG